MQIRVPGDHFSGQSALNHDTGSLCDSHASSSDEEQHSKL